VRSWDGSEAIGQDLAELVNVGVGRGRAVAGKGNSAWERKVS
jgi:hypothetical protein